MKIELYEIFKDRNLNTELDFINALKLFKTLDRLTQEKIFHSFRNGPKKYRNYKFMEYYKEQQLPKWLKLTEQDKEHYLKLVKDIRWKHPIDIYNDIDKYNILRGRGTVCESYITTPSVNKVRTLLNILSDDEIDILYKGKPSTFCFKINHNNTLLTPLIGCNVGHRLEYVYESLYDGRNINLDVFKMGFENLIEINKPENLIILDKVQNIISTLCIARWWYFLGKTETGKKKARIVFQTMVGEFYSLYAGIQNQEMIDFFEKSILPELEKVWNDTKESYKDSKRNKPYILGDL